MSLFRRGGPAGGERVVRVRVKRFDPRADRRPRWQEYRVRVGPKMSVLDALFAILEEQDGSLGFRCSCAARRCGSCAVVVNGRERLACGTPLDELGAVISLEPLRHLPVVRDLVVDMVPFFARYAAVKPYFVGRGARELALVPPGSGERALVSRQLDCLTCAACYSACPIVGLNPAYLGPAALNRVLCLVADERDAAGRERLETVADAEGLFGCRGVSNCEVVCPMGIQPWRSIQRLRRWALFGGKGG